MNGFRKKEIGENFCPSHFLQRALTKLVVISYPKSLQISNVQSPTLSSVSEFCTLPYYKVRQPLLSRGRSDPLLHNHKSEQASRERFFPTKNLPYPSASQTILPSPILDHHIIKNYIYSYPNLKIKNR
jgi:hypothetical protein